MKITKNTLKQLIKEEFDAMTEEESFPEMAGDKRQWDEPMTLEERVADLETRVQELEEGRHGGI